MTHELSVSEATVWEAVGELRIPRTGVVEQTWKTNPVPTDELASRAADAVGDLDFEGARGR